MKVIINKRFYLLTFVSKRKYNMDIRTVNVTRYILPLREGGSLPALADADDGYKYVVKFRGSGHGTKALVSELLGGMIAKRLGFRVPEIVYVYLDEAFGRTEGDEEIQDLLKGSEGLNMGLHFLSPALTFDPVVTAIDSRLASRIVWLDAYITNIDRTFRNTNMLIFHKELWLIDHGASFFFHHSWGDWQKAALSPFVYVKDHVLLSQATEIAEADKLFKEILDDKTIEELVDEIPADWLDWNTEEQTVVDIRNVYKQFLKRRRDNSQLFVKEAQNARNAFI